MQMVRHHLKCHHLYLWMMVAYSLPYLPSCRIVIEPYLIEVEIHLVMVEGQAIGGAEKSQDVHDVLLLTGR